MCEVAYEPLRQMGRMSLKGLSTSHTCLNSRTCSMETFDGESTIFSGYFNFKNRSFNFLQIGIFYMKSLKRHVFYEVYSYQAEFGFKNIYVGDLLFLFFSVASLTTSLSEISRQASHICQRQQTVEFRK